MAPVKSRPNPSVPLSRPPPSSAMLASLDGSSSTSDNSTTHGADASSFPASVPSSQFAPRTVGRPDGPPFSGARPAGKVGGPPPSLGVAGAAPATAQPAYFEATSSLGGASARPPTANAAPTPDSLLVGESILASTSLGGRREGAVSVAQNTSVTAGSALTGPPKAFVNLPLRLGPPWMNDPTPWMVKEGSLEPIIATGITT